MTPDNTELVQQVMGELQGIMTHEDFPFSLPYVTELVEKYQDEGVQDYRDIAVRILMSIAEERPGSEEGPFYTPHNIPVSIFNATGMAGMLLQYTMFSLENEDIPGSVRPLFYLRFLLFDILEGSMSQATLDSNKPPGGQVIYLPQAGLAVTARIFENAIRLLETGVWKISGGEKAAFEWANRFRQHAIILRNINGRLGETGDPTPQS